MLQLKEALDTAPSDQPNFRKLDLNDRNWMNMEWIPKFSDEVLRILEQVAFLAYQQPPASAVSVLSGLVGGVNRLDLNQMTRQEILDYNLKNDLGLLDRMVKVRLRTFHVQEAGILTVLAARLTAFPTLEMHRAFDP
jgi:hypothetical protein